MKKCIILANGQPPKKTVINFLRDTGYSTLICADGGADTAMLYKLSPDFIIGDLDSISPEAFKYYSKKCRIIKIKRQSDTDVEKCLKYAIKNRFTEAILLGGTGDRLDHSFCNLGIVLKFSNRIKITVIHQKSLLRTYSGDITLKTVRDETISVYGINDKTKIVSRGLKYTLKNISLPFGEKESTSNIALGEKVELKIRNGNVFIVRDFQLMRIHGLI